MSAPKETAVPRRWRSEILKFGMKQVYSGQFSTLNEEITRLTFRALGLHQNEIRSFFSFFSIWNYAIFSQLGMFMNK